MLWDKQRQTIVNNESADIVRMLNGAFGGSNNDIDLYPPDLRADIDALNEPIYRKLNNGVYRAGFAYVVAGCGVFLWKRWAAQLSAAIAIGTVAVFVALGIYIFLGGAFEARTIGAMTVRSLIRTAIAVAVCRGLECFPRAVERRAHGS